MGKRTAFHPERFAGPRRPKFLSPVLVLACGSTGRLAKGLPLEIVGVNTSEGLCTTAQIPDGSLFAGLCLPQGVNWHEIWAGPIHAEYDGWGAGGSEPTQTKVSGDVDPGVAEVEVRFHRNGDVEVKSAVLAQVDGTLLERLGQDEPFGRFAAVLPGCIPPSQLRFVARDSEGQLLAARRTSSPLPHSCLILKHRHELRDQTEP